jgi:hypothetical protein
MTATYDEQYRPVSDEETAAEDGLSIRAVRDTEIAINNYMRFQGACKVIGQPCIPHWGSEDTADVAENLVVPPFPPFLVPPDADSLSVSLGCYQSATAGNEVTFRLYAATSLYQEASIVVDTDAMSIAKTSVTLVCDTAALVANNTIVHGQLSIPLGLGGGPVPVVYLILTGQNTAGGERAYITSIDVTPEHA